MVDTHKHKGMRKLLVDALKVKGIEDVRVLNAINAVPRHLFLDNAFEGFAYEDKAFPIAAGQTISQPYTVAFQTSLLQLNKGEKVLEIGTGSGYQTAVLCEMGVKVFTIERQRALYDITRVFLPKLNYSPKFFYGDGYAGLPTFAPFDKILVTAGAPHVPEALKAQLKVGGILVIPVGDLSGQVMVSMVKKSATEFEVLEHGDFRFVPMLNKKSG